jgi:hypothetical protein
MWEQINEILTQSASQITAGIARFLPGLLALIFVVLLAVVIAWIAGAVFRQSLKRISFDARLAQWGFDGLADWSPARSPTLLLVRIIRWTVILLGLLVGTSALDADLTSRLVVGLFGYLPNVVAAILVLIVGTIIARFLARGVLISAVNMQMQSARLLSLGVKWLVLVLAGAMALEHLGIGEQIVELSFAILFGGIVLALALAVGLGSKDMVSRTWERQASKSEEQQAEEPFHHL